MRETKNPKTWKKIIDLVIIILTTIGSFISGNVIAENTDFKLKEMLNQKVEINE